MIPGRCAAFLIVLLAATLTPEMTGIISWSLHEGVPAKVMKSVSEALQEVQHELP